METIFAMCSGVGKAGVAVVRVSGPSSWKITKRLCGKLPKPREMVLKSIVGIDGIPIDKALIVCFQKDKSFTGEKTTELHLHGSTAVVVKVLKELSKFPELKMAEPGEFTRQAFENGCLDLAQVEGLADLIDAETEAQRLQAQRVLDGAVGKVVGKWRSELTRAAALVEATIDFVDEDVPMDVLPEVSRLISNVLAGIKNEIVGVNIAERVRIGFEVAIVGPPNVGKSTLLNAIARREVAITSEYAGTTRDVVEVRLDLEGLPVLLVDTAGIREAMDPVEKIGVEWAKNRAAKADLRVFLADKYEFLGIERRAGDIVIKPKGDLRPTCENSISGRTGMGVDGLIAQVVSELRSRCGLIGDLSRHRHKTRAAEASYCLEAVLEHINADAVEVDLVAAELNTALRTLEALVGSIGVEDILGEIFGSFCIGK